MWAQFLVRFPFSVLFPHHSWVETYTSRLPIMSVCPEAEDRAVSATGTLPQALPPSKLFTLHLHEAYQTRKIREGMTYRYSAHFTECFVF